MATADQVKALIRCHADGDDARFYAIAMQVAAQAARSGHGKFAQELREMVDQVKARAKTVEPARILHIELTELGGKVPELIGIQILPGEIHAIDKRLAGAPGARNGRDQDGKEKADELSAGVHEESRKRGRPVGQALG